MPYTRFQIDNINDQKKGILSRNIVKITPRPFAGGFVIISFEDGSAFLLTHDQLSTSEEVYIVDTINLIPPTSMLGMAAQINGLVKY